MLRGSHDSSTTNATSQPAASAQTTMQAPPRIPAPPSAVSPSTCFTPASEFALSFLLALVEYGVRDFVVCPGSRSQALALAAAELEQACLARLHVRIDERDAAFLALGLSLGSSSNPATRTPAAVITTSGSAVANLFPAAVEASRTGIPLIYLTADRPDSMRGTGANQTMHQADFFGSYAILSMDVSASESSYTPLTSFSLAHKLTTAGTQDGFLRGLAHANIQFTEPLSGSHTPLPQLHERVRTALPHIPSTSRHSGFVLSEADVTPSDSFLVAGYGADPRLAARCHAAGIPVIAEITSGARAWHSVTDYHTWLTEGADGRRTMLVSGLANLSREAWAFASREDVHLIAVEEAELEVFSPRHRARCVTTIHIDDEDPTDNPSPSLRVSPMPAPPASPTPPASPSVPHAPTPSLPPVFAPEKRPTRVDIVHLLWAVSEEENRNHKENESAIYLAASRMARVADRHIGSSSVAVFSHRGLAGIDGTLSAAAGVSLARSLSVPTALTRLLIGDLAFAHDVGGLALPPGEGKPHLQILVVNDGGGSIFAGLEVAQADPVLYERVVKTPQRLNISALASAYGWEYTEARTNSELATALREARPGIIEVRPAED